MALKDTLFGSSQKQTSSGTSSSTATSKTKSDMEQLSTLLESMIGASTGTTTKGGVREDEGVTQLMQVLSTFMKDPIATARETSRGAVDSAMNRILAQGIPGISTAGTMSGGYNSTTQALMKDNLVAQAAAAGAEVEQKAIVDFATVQQNAFQNFLTAIQTGLERTAVQKAEEETKRTGTESTEATTTEDATMTEEAKQTGVVKGTATDSLVGGISKAVAAFKAP